MMAKNPVLRYQSTAEALDDIRNWESLTANQPIPQPMISNDFSVPSRGPSGLVIGGTLVAIGLIALVAVSIAMMSRAQINPEPIVPRARRPKPRRRA